MTDVSLTIAFILIAVAISAISKFVNNLSKEIGKLKVKLERLQNLCDWQDHEKRIDQLEEALELKEYFDEDTLNEE